MFLNLLNKREKEDFIELAYHAMLSCGGQVNDTEMEMFNAFKVETELTSYELKNLAIAELIGKFNGSTKKVKRVILVELLAVLLVDEKFNKNEENFIRKIAKAWNIRETEVKRMTRWVEDFNDLLDEGFKYIAGKE